MQAVRLPGSDMTTVAPFPATLLQRCPLCSSDAELMFTAVDENHRISGEQFVYLKCRNCECVFLSEAPADLGRYYQAEYYDIPSLERLQKVAHKDRNKINTVLRFAQGGRLLEIGPAFGVFAWQAKQAGFMVDVVEMDTRCCAYLQNTLGVNVTQSDNPAVAIQALPRHDVIALWHVLEHLPDPLAFLRAASENLMPGGLLIIAMPNPDAWQFEVMGRRWPHLDAPRHLTLIPVAWLERQAMDFGLEKTYFTSDDSDARSWNLFGWQRLLMNRVSGKFSQRIMFIFGYILSLLMTPFDRRSRRGSAYTVVFRKKQAT